MSNQWAPPIWQVPAAVTRTRIPIRAEVIVGLLATAYSVLLGAIVGVVWAHLAPHVDLIRAAEGSEAASKALLGDDMWFALFGIAAGVVSAAILLVATREAGRGPGGVIGLAVGGFVGSVVAAHLGHHIQKSSQLSILHQHQPQIPAGTITVILHYFAFEVRAKAVLLAWPIAVVLLHGGTVIARSLRSADSR